MSQLHTRISLDTVYFKLSLLEWVNVIHTEVSSRYEMKKIKIRPYDFGYDSYAHVLNSILSNVTMNDIMASIRNAHDVNKFVELAHAGWVTNYLYWKNSQNDDLSDNPKKSINTSTRNDRATTEAKNLNATDLELYQDIINIVFEVLTQRIFNAGMEHLSIN